MAEALDRVQVARRVAPEERFIERFGHVRYIDVLRKPPAWRVAYAKTAACEMGGCGREGAYAEVLIFDHCHRHGWVRGMLCNGHNVHLGRIEAVAALDGVIVNLGSSVLGEFVARCPDCAGAGAVAARGPFAPADPPWLARHRAAEKRREALMSVGAPVARPGSATAHLPLGDGLRTVCGKVADAMVAADLLPVCTLCTRSVERVRGALG
jgi:hypothetical protein